MVANATLTHEPKKWYVSQQGSRCFRSSSNGLMDVLFDAKKVGLFV
jgi:hypothetical protein